MAHGEKGRTPTKNTSQDDDGRTSVGKYPNTANWPLEVGDKVWLKADTFRGDILGYYRITKALPNDQYELEKVDDGTAHPGPVDGSRLDPDPWAAN